MYKIKPVLFLFALVCWRQQTLYSKETRNYPNYSIKLAQLIRNLAYFWLDITPYKN
jgi:hypothetical protein